jgi:hypothetical protein
MTAVARRCQRTTVAGVTICMAWHQLGQTLEGATTQPIDWTKARSCRCGPLQYGQLMPNREDFRPELKSGADRGPKRGEQGHEHRSHPARGR